jgi:hypothetical protein
MSGGTTDYPHWRPEFSLIAKADVGLGWMNPAADDFPAPLCSGTAICPRELRQVLVDTAMG